MPSIAFFPWAQVDEAFDVGRFALIPMAEAERAGAIPSELIAPARAVLTPYQVRPEARLDRVPLLYHVGSPVCDELTDETAADLFAFRVRLACAALAARQFFANATYCNSDNFELIAQNFSPDLAGAVAVMSRRRDGSVRNLVSASARRETRPYHVASAAMMPRTLDIALLRALDATAELNPPDWPRVEEAIGLFVGANTDGPSVTVHGELVDLVSAFGRLADAWTEVDIVAWFAGTLPEPNETHLDLGGPKLALCRMQRELQRRPSVRAVWLADAYRLRGDHAHGRVVAPAFPSIWTAREHLLLGAVAFPLALKAMLALQHRYVWTAEDATMNEAFDALATLEPFATPTPAPDPEDDLDESPWRRVLTQIQYRHFVDQITIEALPSSAESAADPDQA